MFCNKKFKKNSKILELENKEKNVVFLIVSNHRSVFVNLQLVQNWIGQSAIGFLKTKKKILKKKLVFGIILLYESKIKNMCEQWEKYNYWINCWGVPTQ